jgi:hypothetical protein
MKDQRASFKSVIPPDQTSMRNRIREKLRLYGFLGMAKGHSWGRIMDPSRFALSMNFLRRYVRKTARQPRRNDRFSTAFIFQWNLIFSLKVG